MAAPQQDTPTSTLDAVLACMRAPKVGGLTRATLDGPLLLERLGERYEPQQELLALIGELLEVEVYLGKHAKAASAAQTLREQVIAVLTARLANVVEATLPPELRAPAREKARTHNTMPSPKGGASVSVRGRRR